MSGQGYAPRALYGVERATVRSSWTEQEIGESQIEVAE